MQSCAQHVLGIKLNINIWCEPKQLLCLEWTVNSCGSDCPIGCWCLWWHAGTLLWSSASSSSDWTVVRCREWWSMWSVPQSEPLSNMFGMSHMSGVRMWQQQPVQTCVTAPRDQHGRRRKRLRTEREMRCGQLKQTKRERHIQPFILIHIMEVFIGGWDEFKFLTFSISETDS